MAKKTITYNEAVKEIEEILQNLEEEELDVDQLADKVKRATELIHYCKSKLKNTEAEINKILDTEEKGE
ncbi:MAG: exodeoxyribonuclease VII small subunit [Bacteroidales bacterium]|nr:exodeoxyribonuclease VII small subunit [Bacteroidales bacterium]MCF8390187.1 exodeoxyribonuclease VII small subunit [Bacteroidales bacterium]